MKIIQNYNVKSLLKHILTKANHENEKTHALLSHLWDLIIVSSKEEDQRETKRIIAKEQGHTEIEYVEGMDLNEQSKGYLNTLLSLFASSPTNCSIFLHWNTLLSLMLDNSLSSPYLLSSYSQSSTKKAEQKNSDKKLSKNDVQESSA